MDQLVMAGQAKNVKIESGNVFVFFFLSTYKSKLLKKQFLQLIK